MKSAREFDTEFEYRAYLAAYYLPFVYTSQVGVPREDSINIAFVTSVQMANKVIDRLPFPLKKRNRRRKTSGNEWPQ